MMLWYKAWRESRGRFALAAIVLFGYCYSFVERARLDFPPSFDPLMPYSTFIWHGIYSGPAAPIFIVVSFVFGLGGLHRERATGTHVFTLALPVSRASLVLTRAAIGIIEAVLLAAIPVAVVPSLSPLYAGRTYPVAAALRFGLFFSIVGSVWVAAGVLASTWLKGEHSGVTAAVLIPALYAAAVSIGPVNQRMPALNLVNVMTGAHMPNFDAATSLYVGPPPWVAMCTTAALSAVLIAGAARIAEQQDF